MPHHQKEDRPYGWKGKLRFQKGITYRANITVPELINEMLLTLQKKFLIVKEKRNFDGSQSYCKSLNGNLALPESQEENQRIMEEIRMLAAPI